MTETTELTIKRIVDGYRVKSDEMDRVVNGIKIAGNELEMNYGTIDKVTVTDFAIEGEYDPYLLIEPTSWCTAEEDTNE